MTQAEFIAEVEARLKEVPAGPWDWEYGVSQRTAWALTGPGQKYLMRFEGGNDIMVCPDPEPVQDFIAEAPRDVARLLRIVKRLRGELEARKPSHYTCEDFYYNCPKANDPDYGFPKEGEACECGADDNMKSVEAALEYDGAEGGK